MPEDISRSGLTLSAVPFMYPLPSSKCSPNSVSRISRSRCFACSETRGLLMAALRPRSRLPRSAMAEDVDQVDLDTRTERCEVGASERSLLLRFQRLLRAQLLSSST